MFKYVKNMLMKRKQTSKRSGEIRSKVSWHICAISSLAKNKMISSRLYGSSILNADHQFDKFLHNIFEIQMTKYINLIFHLNVL